MDTFQSLLEQLSNLPSIPLDAREQFDGMLRESFPSAVESEGDCCTYCEARPGDNDHCVGDGSAHAWHVCGDHLRTAFIDSNCAASREAVAR